MPILCKLNKIIGQYIAYYGKALSTIIDN